MGHVASGAQQLLGLVVGRAGRRRASSPTARSQSSITSLLPVVLVSSLYHPPHADSGRRRTGGAAFTVELPRELPVRRGAGDAWWIDLPERELRLSNLDKIFWPEEGYTKGDLLAYYFNVADLLLPHLERRPLTMKRMPDGIDGDSFYEKTAPSHTPDWVHRCTVLSEDAKEGRIDYLTVDDLATLLFVANLGAIEMHPLHSRCSDTGHPDYLFFDLDPFPPYTYEDVLTVARHIKVLLDQLGLTGYPKTSGATGMQIFMPLEAGRWTYEEVRAFVGACGRMIGRADPDRVTMAWRIADRTGKIFIDHNMNRQGANIAAAYSLRPEPRAPVSTPLTWDEVEAGGFEPQDFRIDNVWERFARVGDLWAPVREGPSQRPRPPAMEALGVEVEEDPSGPLPRTAAKAVEAKTSDEIALASKDPALFEYVRRREFGPEGTTEPAPGDEAGAGNSFVIHKHRATRLHYDVRLERDGALPVLGGAQGPADRQGRQAHGRAHRGPPARVREVRGHDPGRATTAPARSGSSTTAGTSRSSGTTRRSRSGCTGGATRTWSSTSSRPNRDWLAFLASAQTRPLIASPPRFSPMLAEGGHEAFDDDGWWFEPKLDGIRCLAELSTGETVLRTRTGRDVTAQYPELHMIHELVDQVNAVIDGEIVAFDADGKNSFEALQGRMNLSNPREIDRARKRLPVSLVVFDLLWLDGHDLTGLPLEQRRELLSLRRRGRRPAARDRARRRRGQGDGRGRRGAAAGRSGRQADRLAVRARASAPTHGARSSCARRRTA